MVIPQHPNHLHDYSSYINILVSTYISNKNIRTLLIVCNLQWKLQGQVQSKFFYSLYIQKIHVNHLPQLLNTTSMMLDISHNIHGGEHEMVNNLGISTLNGWPLAEQEYTITNSTRLHYVIQCHDLVQQTHSSLNNYNVVHLASPNLILFNILQQRYCHNEHPVFFPLVTTNYWHKDYTHIALVVRTPTIRLPSQPRLGHDLDLSTIAQFSNTTPIIIKIHTPFCFEKKRNKEST
jgi:hypothetical protein